MKTKFLLPIFAFSIFTFAYEAKAAITVGSSSITGSSSISLQPASGNVGIGTTNPSRGKLAVITTVTDPSISSFYGVDLEYTLNPTANSSTNARGISNYLLSDYDNTRNLTSMIGLLNTAEHDGTGSISWIKGSVNYGYNYRGSSVTDLIGSESTVESDTGSITTMTALHLWGGTYGGSVTTLTGLRLDDLEISGATVSNRYGIKIETMAGSATNDYAIYSQATQKSYFAGNIGIGVTTNQTGSKLEVKDGHIASSQTTAPTPSVTGTGYSGASMGSNSTDTKGGITATVGAAAGTLVVTFQTAYATAPYCTVTPATATAQVDSGKMYITTATGALTLNFVATPTGGSETWHYHCIQ